MPCSAVNTEHDLSYTVQQGVGVTAYTKLLSASHHLLKPPETYIMHATPVQSPSRIKYWTKNNRHAVLKAPPLWSIFISLVRLLFRFLSVARSKWALAIGLQPRADHGWLGMLPWRRPHFHRAVDARSKTRTKDGRKGNNEWCCLVNGIQCGEMGRNKQMTQQYTGGR